MVDTTVSESIPGQELMKNFASTPGMWKRKQKLEAEVVEAVFFCGSGSAKNSTASAST